MEGPKMWTSKLNNKYPLAWIQENDRATQAELKRLRGLKQRGNHRCADCGLQGTTWASVTHGVFICVVCSDVHRSVGTHITKVKGCTGTYLWGPDEIEVMQTVGNAVADSRYGDKKVSPQASKEEKQRYVVGKYQPVSTARAGAAQLGGVFRAPAAATEAAKLSSEPSAVTAEGAEVFFAAPRVAKEVAPTSTYVVGPRSQRASAVVGVCAGGTSTSNVSSVIARRSDISDDFFEDLFGESSATAVCRKPTDVQQPLIVDSLFDDWFKEDTAPDVEGLNPQAHAKPDYNDLDEFLNAALGGC